MVDHAHLLERSVMLKISFTMVSAICVLCFGLFAKAQPETESYRKPVAHKKVPKKLAKRTQSADHVECWGFHGSCSDHNGSRSSCDDQVGCFWNSSSESCSGSSYSCSDADSEYRCEKNSGCHWDN